ncbi:hypothetical protein E1298_17560 [Actinomadura rubrisoli]|uniref:Alanine racemase C-terminal domain-containing protein n=1 Tax=Actinomadura rubrisoli TaxID=2530368 RepID=A0A4R5BM57_9ACTN|nr:hypothetical protein E1298_17560 [Actinomadura rubrisoli]
MAVAGTRSGASTSTAVAARARPGALASASEYGPGFRPSAGTRPAGFKQMVEYAERAEVRPEVRHLANSIATLTLPESRFDLVRPGHAIYGLAGGRRRRISGRVCMDQLVIDLGDDAGLCAGDEVVLFGPGNRGEPTAQEWADALGTISYEIVTRIGPRVPRVYEGRVQDRPAAGRSLDLG